MKVAVSAISPRLSSQIDPRFDRCRYLLFIDTETMECEAVENPNIMAIAGTGIETAQFVANKGAQVVVTGHCGPNTYQTLTAAGIEVFRGIEGIAEEAVRRYNRGELRSAPTEAERQQGRVIMSTRLAMELKELKEEAQTLSQRLGELHHRLEELERRVR